MEKRYLVVYTAGAFGNFLSWCIDCCLNKQVLESPFQETGNSHHRNQNTVITQCLDLVKSPNMEEYLEKKQKGFEIIGIHWGRKWFPYMLHAGWDRTNGGQFGKSGVAFAETNFHKFLEMHGEYDTADLLSKLKQHFNFDCSEGNPKVPRLVLRNLLWLNMASENQDIRTKTNKIIEKAGHSKIDLDTILDYDLLKEYLKRRFDVDLDFEHIHKEFIRKNNSLTEYNLAMKVIDAVKTKQNMLIPKMSVVGECIVLWHLEKHYFDINFFNMPFDFATTKDILDYVAHYPNYMKSPNRWYLTNWKDFPNDEKR